MAAVGLQKTLGFEILPEVKPGEVEARFTVTEAVAQPYGYCSGGTMLALEETMAGAGSRRIAGEDAMPLGINVSANHVKAVPVGGLVTARATALRTGYRLHVWNVDLFDEAGDLVSTARVTTVITRRKTAEEH